jgi:hypothetical protein
MRKAPGSRERLRYSETCTAKLSEAYPPREPSGSGYADTSADKHILAPVACRLRGVPNSPHLRVNHYGPCGDEQRCNFELVWWVAMANV